MKLNIGVFNSTTLKSLLDTRSLASNSATRVPSTVTLPLTIPKSRSLAHFRTLS